MVESAPIAGAIYRQRSGYNLHHAGHDAAQGAQLDSEVRVSLAEGDGSTVVVRDSGERRDWHSSATWGMSSSSVRWAHVWRGEYRELEAGAAHLALTLVETECQREETEAGQAGSTGTCDASATDLTLECVPDDETISDPRTLRCISAGPHFEHSSPQPWWLAPARCVERTGGMPGDSGSEWSLCDASAD